jgi:hypothetical protein
MPLPTPMLLGIYVALVLALLLIVRRSYIRSFGQRDVPTPDQFDKTAFPYSAPPDSRKRAYDWSTRR